MNRIQQILREAKVHSVIPETFLGDMPFVFDFTKENKRLSEIHPHDTVAFSQYINKVLNKDERILGIGQYGEDRTIYRSSLYTREGEARSVHLGIDLFVPAGTAVFAPLNGIVHSFQDNHNFLDYGPTIVLEHNLKGITFYTLYGHLSRNSLKKLTDGERFIAGGKIAAVGRPHENGSWPSHVHFQIVTDMLGFRGDFPGVVRPAEKEYYLKLCPDPNLILQLPT